MATKKTGPATGSKASSVLTSKNTGKASKSAAGSALAQVKSTKNTSAKAASAASKALRDERTSATSKAAAGSALGAADWQEGLIRSAAKVDMASRAEASAVIEGEVEEVHAGLGLAHVRGTDGLLYGVNRKTPGITFDALCVGQRLRCEVTSKFHRVVRVEALL